MVSFAPGYKLRKSIVMFLPRLMSRTVFSLVLCITIVLPSITIAEAETIPTSAVRIAICE